MNVTVQTTDASGAPYKAQGITSIQFVDDTYGGNGGFIKAEDLPNDRLILNWPAIAWVQIEVLEP